ncbi:helix-turn-helix domain-containing protein [Novibacillus thermophilus]|uniref:helix-turn-helix domain-containing protein n=1 Tax=Novibacillus thermophilus TaxID=1471761 RepID=UPI001E3113F9|nr:helix-turn-helix transcriptional regulator [Novibacillus thermophilus]
MIDVGKRIRELRHISGISGRTLSKMTGLDPSQISKIENGSSKPSLDALDRICKALNVTVHEFFSPETEELPPDLLQLLETTKNLTPEQRKLLNDFLKSLDI